MKLPPPGGGMPASDETNEKRPVIITTNVLFKTVRRALLRVVLSKIPSTAVFFRVLYVRGLVRDGATPGRFISHLVLRERRNEVRRIVRYSDDFQFFGDFCEGDRITQTDCKRFRRFRATALPIVMLNSLRRIDASTTNKPHPLTKREIQTQTAKLGQAVRQIAAANDC